MPFVSSILSRLKALQPATLRRLAFVVAFVGCTAAAFWYGRQQAPQAEAHATPNADVREGPKTVYGQRVVAEIFGSPITREDLGEFLIERFGAERIEFLVNRKIVERECRARGIDVTDAEVQIELSRSIKSMGQFLTEEEFANNILKRFNKTLFEWKEDVIRPKLQLQKLCRPLVKVEEEEIKKAFEARYGPRVEVRLICFTKTDKQILKKYEDAKASEANFDRVATTQEIQHLAAMGGRVPPIHKHFPDKELEKAAFNLKEGEVSSLIPLPDGTKVMLRCEKHIPAEHRLYETVRLTLEGELREQKLTAKIDEVFKGLRDRANPQVYLLAGDRAASITRASATETPTRPAAPPAKAGDLPEPLPPPK